MAIEFVRAKCLTTGAVASLSEKALELGQIKDWVRADGPAPTRPKSAAFPKRKADPAPEKADSESADEKE